MEFLPSIEVLNFLDWIDRKGIAENNKTTIEEFILDQKNSQKLVDAIDFYRRTVNRYKHSGQDMFERKVDLYLSGIKAELMKEYIQRFSITSHDVSKDQMEKMLNSAHRNFMKDYPDWTRRIEIVSLVGDTKEMVHQLREYLNDSDITDEDNYIFSYLKTREYTAAYAMTGFIQWLQENLPDSVRINHIPHSQLDKYISSFLEDYYCSHHVSYPQIQEMEKTIKNTLYNPGNIKYFDGLTERYRARKARYKCVFISEDAAFYDLVEKHWLQLHEYTGDYLDVFYNPKELKPCRGYRVADALDIRSRIDKFPCIYIWRTVLSEGKAIATNGLSFEDLLQLIKEIVDTIQAGKALEEVIDCGNRYAALVRQQICKNKIIEEKVLSNLIRACTQLQNNPIMYSDAIEDQRNTQIRDLMRDLFNSPLSIGDKQYVIRVDDQGFNGLSASGKSLGRPDLFVTVESLPFSIIEGINVTSGVFGSVKEQSKLYEHIERFGNYDQNGLERNILLVYYNFPNQ